MRKNYVPKTLGEFLGESKSITLKRKYGGRPAVNVGTNAPLRNQVLSFVAESGSVSKADLKKFIIGLKENSTPVAANMFISRNAHYFLTESKNGNTMFKLSNLGERLVDQFVDESEHNISESVKNARSKFSSILESHRSNRLNENEGEGEGAHYKARLEELVDVAEKLYKEFGEEDLPAWVSDNIIKAKLHLDDVASYVHSGEEKEEGEENPHREMDDDDDYEEDDIDIDDEEDDDIDLDDEDDDIDLDDEDEDEDNEEIDFGGDEDDDIDDDELEDDELEDDDLDDDELEDDDLEDIDVDDDDEDSEIDFEDEDEEETEDEDEEETDEPNYDFKDKKGRPGITDELDEAQVARMKKMIKNLRLNEAEGEEADELSDEDVDKEADDTADTDEPGTDDINLENETEKVEITEFIITVDDVDSAIEELGELGVTAERVPIEAKPEEVPVEDETEDLTPPPAEGEAPAAPAPATQEQKNESLKRFVANMLNEAEEASDELGLGDQGEVTSELDAQPAADPNAQPATPAAPATEEYEQNKIKVNAQDWDTLKGWLEEKGVNVQEMFGGEIETEDIDPDQPEGAPVSDEEIDFTGIGDDDETEVKVEDKEED